MKEDRQYDIAIIGGGLSGLVCGIYLAKNGFKVVIVEKNEFVGGYFSSIKYEKYRWDIGFHYLFGCQEQYKGILYYVLKELDIQIDFYKLDLVDLVCTPDMKFYFWKDIQKTINHFQKIFPKEKNNIESFFYTITKGSVASLFSKTEGKKFSQFLNLFFEDKYLKSSLGMLLLGNKGILPSQCDAFAGAMFYREFIFKGGYYPKGGSTQFIDTLFRKYKYFGGQTILGNEVEKAKVNNCEQTLFLANGVKLKTKKIVVASDLKKFISIMSRNRKHKNTIMKINDFKTSMSSFVINLAIKNRLKRDERYATLWYFSNYNLQYIYRSTKKELLGRNYFLFLSSPSFFNKTVNGAALTATSLVDYRGKKYWLQNQKQYTDKFINLVQRIIPEVRNNIKKAISLSPVFFHEYTYSQKGAINGWDDYGIKRSRGRIYKELQDKNIFVVGQWSLDCTRSGINLALSSARDVAYKIIRK
jgi:phytoene dehydrogenase-like protein